MVTFWLKIHELMRALCSFLTHYKYEKLLDTLHWLMENIALQLGWKQWTEHNNSSFLLPQPFLLHLEEQQNPALRASNPRASSPPPRLWPPHSKFDLYLPHISGCQKDSHIQLKCKEVKEDTPAQPVGCISNFSSFQQFTMFASANPIQQPQLLG